MKAVKVQYTVNPEYVETNKRNIQKVMDALLRNPIAGMQYSSYTDKDHPNTFIHINMAKDDETMSKLPPKQTTLDLVAAGFNLT